MLSQRRFAKKYTMYFGGTVLKNITKYLGDFKKQLIIGPAFKLTEAIFELIVPLIMAAIIDVGVNNRDFKYIIKMGILLIILGVVGLGCALICQYYAAVASQGYGTKLRNKVFEHINSLSYEQLDRDGLSSTKLITRMTNDINQLQLAVAMLIRLVVRAPFIAIGATIMAIMLDYKLAIIIIVAIILVSLIIFIIMRLSVPYYKVIQGKLENISRITKENLSGIRVVRAFTKEKNEIERFEQGSNDLAKTTLRVGRLSALLSPLVSVVMNLSIIALLWFGGIRVDTGTLTQGEIIAFVNYISQILLAVVVVSNLVVIFTKAFACANRVNDLLVNTVPNKQYGDENTIAIQKSDSDAVVAFKWVSFNYNSNETGKRSETSAISDATLELKSKNTVGVIGATGCGKTTFVNLLSRNYDATEGQVMLFGKNIKDYTRHCLIDNISVVMQQTYILRGTVRDNMRVAKKNATDEEIITALKKACAWEFVSEKEGQLDFIIEFGGKNLSGGQRQRLSIARALLKSSKILILDDCYSALDYKTEGIISSNIALEKSYQLVVVVSQRVRTIKSCDTIVVLDDGNVVGLGTHEELLQRCAIYCEIVKSSQN